MKVFEIQEVRTMYGRKQNVTIFQSRDERGRHSLESLQAMAKEMEQRQPGKTFVAAVYDRQGA